MPEPENKLDTQISRGERPDALPGSVSAQRPEEGERYQAPTQYEARVPDAVRRHAGERVAAALGCPTPENIEKAVRCAVLNAYVSGQEAGR